MLRFHAEFSIDFKIFLLLNCIIDYFIYLRSKAVIAVDRAPSNFLFNSFEIL